MNAATPGPAAHPLGVTWLVVLLSLALVAPATAASGAHGSRRTGFTLTVLHNNDGESDLRPTPPIPIRGPGPSAASAIRSRSCARRRYGRASTPAPRRAW